MIIVELFEYSSFVSFNKTIYCERNSCIKSIEYIDNEYKDVLVKISGNNAYCFFNTKDQYHNPIEASNVWYFPNGNIEIKQHYFNGKIGRLKGPAIEEFFEDGTIRVLMYLIDGKKHRIDNPAVQYFFNNGKLFKQEYWYNDKKHKLDGPAFIRYDEDGTIKKQEYWIEGKKYSKKEFEKIKNEKL